MPESIKEDIQSKMHVTAFRGYRYDSSVVGDAGECIAPPYDVIDLEQQERLYQQSEFNIVRLIKGKRQGGDDDSQNVYTRAAEYLDSFIKSGALKQDGQERIYVYAQDFAIEGQSYRRSGFVALGQLEEYGGSVQPHEQTLTGPKEDRLKLMRATQCQTGQIFVLYSDPDRTIDALLDQACAGEELLQATDDDRVVHRLYAITEQEQIKTITEVMSSKGIFIADGHHRYETALNYYNETGNPRAAGHMMTFVNTFNEGLVVLPTHRLIKNIKDFNPVQFLGRLNEHFDVARMAFDDMVQKKQKQQMMFDGLKVEYESGEHAVGMYFGEGAFYVATLRDMGVMDNIAGEKSEAWRRLDVTVLHKLILEKLLGIDEAVLAAQTNVEYIKDFGEATQQGLDKVDSGVGQGMFFLNPTRIQEVEDVARNGEKMPQKSTFFYPKVYSGLVLNLLK